MIQLWWAIILVILTVFLPFSLNQTCQEGYYNADITLLTLDCQLCDSSCFNCNGETSSDCTHCEGRRPARNGICPSCASGTYEALDGSCQSQVTINSQYTLYTPISIATSMDSFEKVAFLAYSIQNEQYQNDVITNLLLTTEGINKDATILPFLATVTQYTIDPLPSTAISSLYGFLSAITNIEFDAYSIESKLELLTIFDNTMYQINQQTDAYLDATLKTELETLSQRREALKTSLSKLLVTSGELGDANTYDYRQYQISPRTSITYHRTDRLADLSVTARSFSAFQVTMSANGLLIANSLGTAGEAKIAVMEFLTVNPFSIYYKNGYLLSTSSAIGTKWLSVDKSTGAATALPDFTLLASNNEFYSLIIQVSEHNLYNYQYPICQYKISGQIWSDCTDIERSINIYSPNQIEIKNIAYKGIAGEINIITYSFVCNKYTYYSSTGECLPCLSSCQTCSSSTSCDNCHGLFTIPTGYSTCSCGSGYAYDFNTLSCITTTDASSIIGAVDMSTAAQSNLKRYAKLAVDIANSAKIATITARQLSLLVSDNTLDVATHQLVCEILSILSRGQTTITETALKDLIDCYEKIFNSASYDIAKFSNDNQVLQWLGALDEIIYQINKRTTLSSYLSKARNFYQKIVEEYIEQFGSANSNYDEFSFVRPINGNTKVAVIKDFQAQVPDYQYVAYFDGIRIVIPTEEIQYLRIVGDTIVALFSTYGYNPNKVSNSESIETKVVEFVLKYKKSAQWSQLTEHAFAIDFAIEKPSINILECVFWDSVNTEWRLKNGITTADQDDSEIQCESNHFWGLFAARINVCDTNCKTCDRDVVTECTSCIVGRMLVDSECVSEKNYAIEDILTNDNQVKIKNVETKECIGMGEDSTLQVYDCFDNTIFYDQLLWSVTVLQAATTGSSMKVRLSNAFVPSKIYDNIVLIKINGTYSSIQKNMAQMQYDSTNSLCRRKYDSATKALTSATCDSTQTTKEEFWEFLPSLDERATYIQTTVSAITETDTVSIVFDEHDFDVNYIVDGSYQPDDPLLTTYDCSSNNLLSPISFVEEGGKFITYPTLTELLNCHYVDSEVGPTDVNSHQLKGYIVESFVKGETIFYSEVTIYYTSKLSISVEMNTDAEITGILVKRISDANTRITTFVPTIKLANGEVATDEDPLEVTGSYFDLEVSLPSGVSSQFQITLPDDGGGNNIGTMSNIFDSYTVGLTLLSSSNNIYVIRVDITSVTEAGKYILEFIADLTIITRRLLEQEEEEEVSSSDASIVTEKNVLKVSKTFQRNLDLLVEEETSTINYKSIVTILIIVGIIVIILGFIWYLLLKRRYKRYMKNSENKQQQEQQIIQASNEDSQSQSISTLQNGNQQIMSFQDINNTFERDQQNNNQNHNSNIFKKSNFSEDPSSLLNKAFVDPNHNHNQQLGNNKNNNTKQKQSKNLTILKENNQDEQQQQEPQLVQFDLDQE